MKFVDGSESFLTGRVPHLQLDSRIVDEESDFAEIDSNCRQEALGGKIGRPSIEPLLVATLDVSQCVEERSFSDARVAKNQYFVGYIWINL